jgi:formylglycine-generating enzyme required for sulfatase activity
MASSETEYWKRFEGCIIEKRYTLFELIGTGGSSGVFGAEHRIGGTARREVAIKLIEVVRGAENEQLEELVISLELSHPNVLRCHDAGRVTLAQTDLFYLVMERASSNLTGYARRRTPDTEAYGAVFQQIAQGLHYLHSHEKHYVHRDIKPGNVLQVGDAWKLADFGIMQQLRGLTTVMTIQNPGTFPFMSPEANDGKISPAWDIWSLGVLMVYCLTGEYPFRQTQEKTLVQSIREDAPNFAVPIPSRFESVIHGCLTKDYRSRWTAAQVVAALATPANTHRPSSAAVASPIPVSVAAASSPLIAAAPGAGTTSAALSQRITNPKDSAELVLIPAGAFVMGDDDQEDNPRHTAVLSSYYLYRTPVTVGQYWRFCAETGRSLPTAPNFNPGWTKPDLPMVGVDWHDAEAYCRWAGGSLPTEAQWEKAARGPDGYRFPWGDIYAPFKCWASKHHYGDAGGPTRVGLYGVSRYDCTDMAGNVWQWCADWYDRNFWRSTQAQGTDPENQGIGEIKYRILRGGSWSTNVSEYFRSSYRLKELPNVRYSNIGFRVVVVPAR